MNERIRKLLADLGYTHAQLAEALGLNTSSVSNYANGNREPDALACLLLAGVAANEEDRQFFLAASRIPDQQLATILKTLSAHFDSGAADAPLTVRIPVPPNLAPLVRSLVDYLQTPESELTGREIGFRNSIIAVLNAGKPSKRLPKNKPFEP